jgi:hypothetical protein
VWHLHIFIRTMNLVKILLCCRCMHHHAIQNYLYMPVLIIYWCMIRSLPLITCLLIPAQKKITCSLLCLSFLAQLVAVKADRYNQSCHRQPGPHNATYACVIWMLGWFWFLCYIRNFRQNLDSSINSLVVQWWQWRARGLATAGSCNARVYRAGGFK